MVPLICANRRLDAVRSGLAAGCLATLAFLAGQLLAWRQLDGGRVSCRRQSCKFVPLLGHFHPCAARGGRIAGARGDDDADLARARRAFTLGKGAEVRDLLEFPAGRMAGLDRPAHRMGRGFRGPLQANVT